MSVSKNLLGVIAILAMAVSCISATPLISRQETGYHFRDCSLDEQKSIESSLDDMQELARAAIGPSEASNAGQDWYKAWWGTYDSGRVGMLQNEKINTRFEKLAAFKKAGRGTTFVCDRSSSSFCCKKGFRYVGLVSLRPIDDI